MNTIRTIIAMPITITLDVINLLLVSLIIVSLIYIGLNGMDSYINLFTTIIEDYEHKQWCDTHTVRCTIQDLF